MFTRYAFVLASFSFLAVSASGQTAAFSGPLPAVPASIPNSPYSAEIRATSSLKEGDGGWLVQDLPVIKVWRDSLGRTRKERFLESVTPLSLASELRGKVVVVEIEDPIGGFTYTVDTVGRMVHRVSLPAPGSRKAVRPGASSYNEAASQVTREPMAKEMLDGILCDCERISAPMKVPVSPPMKPPAYVVTKVPVAQRTVLSTNEQCSNPVLKVLVSSKMVIPEVSVSEMRLVNISRQEPDRALFRPPDGYAVVDESGPFTIKYGPTQ